MAPIWPVYTVKHSDGDTLKSPEKTKMAYSHTTQSMEPVEEQKYVPVKRYGLFVEEELDNGIQIRSG